MSTEKERTITLTIKDIAKLTTFGTITAMLVAKIEQALNPKYRDELVNGYVDDLSKLTNDKIKSLLDDLYIQLETAKKQANEQK